MNAQQPAGWADRLSGTARITLIVLTSILGFFIIGIVAGFSFAMIEHGDLPTRPVPYLVLAAILATAALVGWVLITLVRSIRRPAMSGFDRRYWRMWGIVVGVSIPIGVALAILGFSGDRSEPFSMVLTNAPIAPLTAILVAVVVIALLVTAAVYYHRAIDDHEERAYLWGSTIGYYFLVLVFPLHWLLARGGLVPALTIGIALLLVLISCIVQAIVWALFKFR